MVNTHKSEQSSKLCWELLEDKLWSCKRGSLTEQKILGKRRRRRRGMGGGAHFERNCLFSSWDCHVAHCTQNSLVRCKRREDNSEWKRVNWQAWVLVSAEAWSVEDGMVMLVAWWGEVGPLVGVHTSLPTNVITCAHTVVHFPPTD